MKILSNAFYAFVGFALIILVFIVLSIAFNEKEGARFWYPISKIYADCPSMSGEYYVLINTIGWRNWPYILDTSDGKEVNLSQNCTTKTLTRFPKLAGSPVRGYDRTLLTPEQQKFVIEGF